MFASQAPIYLTGVLEYTINEVLEGAGVLARLLSDESKTTVSITPRLLRLVITHDHELNEVFKGAIFSGSGGGGSVSKKHKSSIQWKMLTESESESEGVEVKKKKKTKGRGRKGGNKSSRAKKRSRDEEDSDDSVVVVETGGSTRGIKDKGHVRRKEKNR